MTGVDREPIGRGVDPLLTRPGVRSRPADGLTSRQAAVLAFVRRYYRRMGLPPSHREVMTAMGFRSPAAILKHYRSLAGRGLMRQTAGRQSRCWLPVVPAGCCPCCGQPMRADECE